MQNLKYVAYDQLDGGRLRDHQAEGVAIMATTPKTVCADPVGAGKTIQAAGLIAYLKERGEVGPDRPVLWLTEGDQLAHQTARELRRFLPGLTTRNLAGHREMSSSVKEERQRRALAEPADVKVMTYSAWKVRGHLWEGVLPLLILDEVFALKGGGKQYEAVLATTAIAGRIHSFTATLYENNPMEVWHIYSLLHLPHLPTKAEFSTSYVQWRVFENDTQPYAWLNPEAATRFRELTDAHYFCRDDALEDLIRPHYVRHEVWVPLSSSQQASMTWATTRLSGLALATFQKAVVTGARSGPSSRALRAARIIGGFVSADPIAKILLIAERMEELDSAARQLDALGIGYVELRGATKKASRPGLVEDFRNDPDISVLLGSKVVERGLNLQFCRHLVSVGLPDNPGRVVQGVGRIVRHGSPFPRVDHWVVLNEHEYDHRAVDRLSRKEEQAAMLRAQTA